MFAGTPDTVVEQIRAFNDGVGGVGNLLLMGQSGYMTTEEVAPSLKLLAREVMPQLREMRQVAAAQ
jgi:alkanesulfonate monooxygenase SsuD/methylene tetrahydromethanopterin reductase-like flavin-dependent oxidoreductase (luciferase family)